MHDSDNRNTNPQLPSPIGHSQSTQQAEPQASATVHVAAQARASGPAETGASPMLVVERGTIADFESSVRAEAYRDCEDLVVAYLRRVAANELRVPNLDSQFLLQSAASAIRLGRYKDGEDT